MKLRDRNTIKYISSGYVDTSFENEFIASKCLISINFPVIFEIDRSNCFGISSSILTFSRPLETGFG